MHVCVTCSMYTITTYPKTPHSIIRDSTDGANVELTDYKPVSSPEFTVNQVPSGNNQLTTKDESRTPSSYMPEGSYDTLAPADEPQGQSAPPPTQNGQDQQKGKVLQTCLCVCVSVANRGTAVKPVY